MKRARFAQWQAQLVCLDHKQLHHQRILCPLVCAAGPLMNSKFAYICVCKLSVCLSLSGVFHLHFKGWPQQSTVQQKWKKKTNRYSIASYYFYQATDTNSSNITSYLLNWKRHSRMDTLGLANSSVTLVVVQKLDNNLVSARNKTNLALWLYWILFTFWDQLQHAAFFNEHNMSGLDSAGCQTDVFWFYSYRTGR